MSPRLRKRKQNNEHLDNENTKKRKSKFYDDDSDENELKLFPEEESLENEDSSNEDSSNEQDEESLDNEDDTSISVDKDDNPEAYKNLLAVKKEIARTEPDVKSMLLTPMRLEDRAKLCQYYEIYKMQIPNTNEWLECRSRYNTMFKEYKAGYEQSKKYSESDLARMEKEEEKFTGFDARLALKYKILNLKTSKENKEVIYRRYEEFLALDTIDDEFGKLKHWLSWATDFPHDLVKEHNGQNITEFIKKAKDRLDKELHGMEKVKEQILLFMSAKMRNPSMVHANLGLVGPPGTGKTCIARLIADIMDCGFSQISFGGVDKADFLKGHEYTYVGAQPG